MKKATRKTPLRQAMIDTSSLQSSISDGLGAIQSTHKDYFDESIKTVFADSLELDEAVKKGREQENRWDYLLGHTSSGEIVAVEPHSAKQDEVSTVIKKRTAAREHLKGHLRDGVRIYKWLWVASGKVHFADTEKTKRLLDQNGVEFVGRKISSKHLPPAASPAPAPAVGAAAAAGKKIGTARARKGK